MISVWWCVSGWLIGWWLFGSPRSVEQLGPAGPDATTELDIVIPARDEAEVLGGLLGDLASLDRRSARVIVVDDHSADSTRSLAASYAGVEVVPAPELPAGWTGKSWACHTGVVALERKPGTAGRAVADDHEGCRLPPDPMADKGSSAILNPHPLPQVEGESLAAERTLVFLDADVRLGDASADAAGVLAALGARQRVTGGLLSVQPWHSTRAPYEQLSALFNVVAVMATGLGGRGATTGAFGPVLVTSRRDYLVAGGHRAVRAEVVEDLALAANYRSAGLPVELFVGGQLARFRMYPAGLRQLVEGWTKNFATGAAATPLVRLLATCWWIAALGSAAVALVDAARGTVPWWLAGVAYLGTVVLLRRWFARVGSFGWCSAVLHPLLLVAFIGVFLRSSWLTRVRGQVSWRGRRIDVGRSRG